MIKKGIIFILVFLTTFVCIEQFVKISRLGAVSLNDFYEDIGRGRRGNFTNVLFNEGFGIGRINKYRYIGDEISRTKKNGTIRIALLGDSYVESFQVFERNHFGRIAKDKLSDQLTSKQFEFLNFGRSGFNIGDCYAYQHIFVSKFEPDFILYFISNDDLTIKYSDKLRPRTLLERDSLIVSFKFDSEILNTYESTKILTQSSAILNMLNIGRKKINNTPVSKIIFGKIYDWVNPAIDENRKNRIDILNYSLSPITRKIVESLDPDKVIIVNRGIKPINSEFQTLCIENRIRVLDLHKTLDSVRNIGLSTNYWDVTKKEGHWNHNAHAVIGDYLAKEMAKIIECRKPN